MPSTRRAFVGGFAYLGSTVLGGAPTASDRGDADGEATTGARASDGEPTPEPTPGGADPASVSKAVGDAAYVPENETVRIVAAYRHSNREAAESEPPTREPVYEEIPWERWAATECATVAAEAVAERLADELDGNGGASVGVTAGDDGLLVGVAYVVTYDRDGERVSETSVAFDRLVAATPRAVTATVTLDGRTATRTVPTRVRHSQRRYA